MERVITFFAESNLLKEAVGIADIGRGTGGVYTLNISPKKASDGRNACSISCISDGIQSNSTFFVQVGLADMREDGKFDKVDESLTSTKVIGLPASFANVVDTLGATSDKLFFVVTGKEVIVQTRTSKIPVPVVDQPPTNKIPKTKKKIVFEVMKEELLNVLRATNVGMSYIMDVTEPKAFYMRPVLKEGVASLEVLGFSTYLISLADVKITGSGEGFEQDVEGLPFVALRADKLLKIVSSTGVEKIRFTYMVVESEEGKENVDMCLVQCGSGAKHHLKTFSKSLNVGLWDNLMKRFESDVYKISVMAKDVKTAIGIICVTSDKPKNVKARLEVDEARKVLVISECNGRNVTEVANIEVAGDASECMLCTADLFAKAVGAFEFGKKDKDVKVDICLVSDENVSTITMSSSDNTLKVIVSLAAEDTTEEENEEDVEE